MATEFEQELTQDDDGVDEVVATATDPSTADKATATRQPAKVNLDEFEEFRKYKSKTQSELAQERNARLRMEQQLAQIKQSQQQYEQYAIANMTPEEQAKHYIDQANARADAAEQRAYGFEIDRQREAALKEISLRYKVPIEAIEAANDAGHARDLAWEWKEKQVELATAETDEAKAKREQKRAANKPDLGGGSAIIPPTEWEREYQRLEKSGDMAGLMRHSLTAPK